MSRYLTRGLNNLSDPPAGRSPLESAWETDTTSAVASDSDIDVRPMFSEPGPDAPIPALGADLCDTTLSYGASPSTPCAEVRGEGLGYEVAAAPSLLQSVRSTSLGCCPLALGCDGHGPTGTIEAMLREAAHSIATTGFRSWKHIQSGYIVMQIPAVAGYGPAAHHFINVFEAFEAYKGHTTPFGDSLSMPALSTKLV